MAIVIKDLAIEKIFLLLAALFGFLYVFILPPFQSVDENTHFYRAYQISQGSFVSKNINTQIGDELPSSLSNFFNNHMRLIRNIDEKMNSETIKNNFQIKTEPQNIKFTEFRNTSLYSPTCYISQVPGILLGNILSDRIAVTFYLGRLCNLLFYIILAYFAIKTIPFYKIPLLCIALMPMTLSLASAYTSDVILFGLSFLWVSILLNILTNSEKLKIFSRKILYLTIISVFISLSKFYILLLPLIFILPASKFCSKKDYIGSILMIVGISLLGAMYWAFCIKNLSINMNELIANPDLQISFIKSHPIKYIEVLAKTFVIKTPRLYITMVGVLGNQDTPLDFITYFIYPFLIYFGIKSDEFKFSLEKWQKLVIVLTLMLGTIITYTSLYLMWSPVANNIVLGLNGKYFIPLILPLFLLFKSPNAKFNYTSVKYAIILVLILILLSSDFSLMHRFYNITPNLYYKI